MRPRPAWLVFWISKAMWRSKIVSQQSPLQSLLWLRCGTNVILGLWSDWIAAIIIAAKRTLHRSWRDETEEAKFGDVWKSLKTVTLEIVQWTRWQWHRALWWRRCTLSSEINKWLKCQRIIHWHYRYGTYVRSVVVKKYDRPTYTYVWLSVWDCPITASIWRRSMWINVRIMLPWFVSGFLTHMYMM